MPSAAPVAAAPAAAEEVPQEASPRRTPAEPHNSYLVLM